jgi:DNA-binding transcriptional MerR regulator
VKKKLKMKDLERATGVGRETIRFYIREGLLPAPQRPARNVAWYDEAFVERILLVKKLQTERYLPLSVIKSIVAGDQLPPEAEVRTLLDLDRRLTPAQRDTSARAPERLSDLAKRVGLTAKEILAMESAEAINVVARGGHQWVEGRDVAVVEAWARARKAGFTDEMGYTAAALRMYVDFSRWLVSEELRDFAARLTGKVDAERVQHMAEVGIASSGDILRAIHEHVMSDAIARGNVPASRVTRRDADAANDRK